MYKILPCSRVKPICPTSNGDWRLSVTTLGERQIVRTALRLIHCSLPLLTEAGPWNYVNGIFPSSCSFSGHISTAYSIAHKSDTTIDAEKMAGTAETIRISSSSTANGEGLDGLEPRKMCSKLPCK